jgi:hypothetical protein
MPTPTTLRATTLDRLVERLTADDDRKVDVIVPRELVDVDSGRVLVSASPDSAEMVLELGPEFIGSMCNRLNVPVALGRELHARATAAVTADDPTARLDAEFERAAYRQAFDSLIAARFAHDAPARFMLRTYRLDDADTNPTVTHYGRAMLSDRYAIVDNKPALLAVLTALHDAGLAGDADVSADLTDARMRVRVSVPAISYVAAEFLKDYRSPYSYAGTVDEPLVFAGFELSNSETGGGAFQITPRMVIKVCNNGLCITKDVMRSVHLGGKLDTGTIAWSADTQRKALELVASKTHDAVKTFLSADYVEQSIRSLEQAAATPLPEPAATIEVVAKQQGWSDVDTASILSLFIKGGQVTAGGVLQAVTAHAQQVADPERAAEFEMSAVDVMHAAVAAAA